MLGSWNPFHPFRPLRRTREPKAAFGRNQIVAERRKPPGAVRLNRTACAVPLQRCAKNPHVSDNDSKRCTAILPRDVAVEPVA